MFHSILTPLLLTLGPLAFGGAEIRRADDAVPAQVDRILGDWRAGELTDLDAVAKKLVALGKENSPYLCQLLDTRVVTLPVPAVADALGHLGARTSLASLERLGKSSIASERLAAMGALGEMPFRECIPLIVFGLVDVDEAVAERARSVLLLGRHPQRQVVAAVRERLRFSRDKTRLASLLAKLGSDVAHEALIDLLAESAEGSRLSALQGLCMMARREDGGIVTDILGRSRSAVVLKQACLFVGQVRHEAATQHLIDLLSEPRVAANAHWALRRITGQKLRSDPNLWRQWWERSGKKSLRL